MARRSKSWNPVLTQAEVSLLSGPVWSVNPFRNSFSRVSCSRHPTTASRSSGDASSGLFIIVSRCCGSPISDKQDCSSPDSSGMTNSVPFIPMEPFGSDSGVVFGGSSVGAGTAVGIGVSVGAGVSVGISAGISA